MVLGFVIGLALLWTGPVHDGLRPVSFKATGARRATANRPCTRPRHASGSDRAGSRAARSDGAFAVHTWLAAKPAGADRYDRYEVIGWNLRYGRTAVSISDARAPDAEWFGSPPIVVREVRGSDAEAVIAKLESAVASYPYPDTYSAWPGPNSNTFTAHLGREIPELRLTMPSNAIGKDYLPRGGVVARTPSGTGYQVSLRGILGIAAGGDEGFELNVLGLVTGFDVRHPGVSARDIASPPTVSWRHPRGMRSADDLRATRAMRRQCIGDAGFGKTSFARNRHESHCRHVPSGAGSAAAGQRSDTSAVPSRMMSALTSG
jgi:hypothetical protein